MTLAQKTKREHGLDQDLRIADCWKRVRDQLLNLRTEKGHWRGELSASALSTATAVSAISLYLQHQNLDDSQLQACQQKIGSSLDWLVAQQNSDGGWGDTDSNYSNISTSMLVLAAIHLAGKSNELDNVVVKTNDYVELQGGVEGVRRRYGNDKTFSVPILTNCAIAGLVDWHEISALPFEAACVPQKLYRWMRMPVVSYAIPALVAIGQVKHHFDPPKNPLIRLIRNRSIKRSLNVLQRMQPESGGFLEAIPLTSFVVMALCAKGLSDHEVTRKGIQFLCNTYREEGSWPIDSDLATWVSSLSIYALGTADQSKSLDRQHLANTDRPNHLSIELIDWHLDCQHSIVHPFTGAAPGGWGWSDLSGAVPDADDTPGALLALHEFLQAPSEDHHRQTRIIDAAALGCRWLLKLQNRDGGWPTFCKGWGKLPFDRSGTDLTAHVIRGLDRWEKVTALPSISRAIQRGFSYLAKQQRPDGSWLPLWFGNQDNCDDENPIYGTSKVLLAYRDRGLLDTLPALRGLRWLLENGNADGSWGGGPALAGNSDQERRLQMDASDEVVGSIEETALALECLASCHRTFIEADHSRLAEAARKEFSSKFDMAAKFEERVSLGFSWLMEKIENNCYQNPSPIGFYFAKLWYYEKLYPIIFTTAAIGEGINWVKARTKSVPFDSTSNGDIS